MTTRRFAFFLSAALCACPVLAAPAAPLALSIRTTDGAQFNLAALRGRWVIVNQWATWCGPCLREMPDISAYVQKHKAHVAAIGLAYDDISATDLAAFLRKHPVRYPIAKVDLEHPPATLPEPQNLPSTYLVAPDGVVVKHFVGPVDAAKLDAAIATARVLHKDWPAP